MIVNMSHGFFDKFDHLSKITMIMIRKKFRGHVAYLRGHTSGYRRRGDQDSARTYQPRSVLAEVSFRTECEGGDRTGLIERHVVQTDTAEIAKSIFFYDERL